MKILLTGFAPFGGEALNPSYEAVKAIPPKICGADVFCIELPTVFGKSLDVLYKRIAELQPDIVLCVGQAGGRFDLTLERVAINVDDARIPDNDGNQPIDKLIFPDGDTAYFTNLPIKTMVAKAREHNIPASISNTAGTFVCNHTMYGLMYHIQKNKLNVYGGFMHVPYLPEQVLGKGSLPYMTLEMIRDGIIYTLEAAINSILEKKDDIKSVEGKLD